MEGNALKPKIRMDLDFFPIEHEGEQMVGIRDPMGLAENTILIPPHIFYMLALMDGESGVEKIQEGFFEKFEHKPPIEQIEALIKRLDKEGFLDSSDFRVRVLAMEEAFKKAPIRASALAGRSFPESKEELQALVEVIFAKVPEQSDEANKGRLTGIIAPHIDFQRGSKLFAKAYRPLFDEPPPATVLIMGTAHHGDGSPFILARKGFETPLGISELDAGFADHLVGRCSFDIEKGLLSHRTEHSIEFQVVFLQHIFGVDNGPKIVPVLCGNVLDGVGPGESPAIVPEVASFLEATGEAIRNSEGPVLIVAGADMSHVGPRFGSVEPLTPEFTERVRTEDKVALRAAAEGDAEAFFQKVAEIENRNNICSVTQIYALLKLLGNPDGKLLSYDMAVNEQNGTAVGFAALNFWQKS